MPESNLQRADVEAVLAEFMDPETGRSITQLEQVHHLQLESGRVSMTLGLSSYSAPIWEETRERLAALLREKLPGLSDVQIEISEHERPPVKLGQVGLTAKSVIVVGSGKGGVGKSTIAASLALGMQRAGCKVGLMDADVYGPSIPHLLGASGRPEVHEKEIGSDETGNPVVSRRITPIDVAGLKVMSIGFLVPADKAVIWRGPMLHGSITSFLRDTEWGPLDYLVIDMPPGTGDIALTLSQTLPPTGAVIVCTPQDVALLDAVKAIRMFQEVRIPVLGVVENMSYFLCPDNGKRYNIFGNGGAKKKAEELEIPFLGEIPINMQMRINGDEGKTKANFDVPEVSPPLEQLCKKLVAQLASKHQEKPPLPSLSVL